MPDPPPEERDAAVDYLAGEANLRLAFPAERPAFTRLIGRLAGFLASWKGEMDHPRPEPAIRLALVMAMPTIREKILFPETTMWPSLLGVTEEEFQAELAESFLRQCGVRKSGARLAAPGRKGNSFNGFRAYSADNTGDYK